MSASRDYVGSYSTSDDTPVSRMAKRHQLVQLPPTTSRHCRNGKTCPTQRNAGVSCADHPVEVDPSDTALRNEQPVYRSPGLHRSAPLHSRFCGPQQMSSHTSSRCMSDAIGEHASTGSNTLLFHNCLPVVHFAASSKIHAKVLSPISYSLQKKKCFFCWG